MERAIGVRSAQRKLREALLDLGEVEALVHTISGGCGENFLADASHRMMILAPQIKALATCPHVSDPTCKPLLDELKRRAALLSQEYARRVDLYKRSILAPAQPEPNEIKEEPPAPQKQLPAGEKRTQKDANKQQKPSPVVNEEEAKRLRNMALFDQMVKKESKKELASGGAVGGKHHRRRSIGQEFASVELKEKPKVNKDFPPPIAQPKRKPPQQPFNSSREFHSKGHLLAAHKLGDGFYDLLLPPSERSGELPRLEALIANEALSPGAVIIVNSSRDANLTYLVSEADKFTSPIPDTMLKAKMLSLFVSNTMGGSRVDDRHSTVAELHVADLKMVQEKPCSHVYLGQIAHGTLRHRAILYKYLADLVGVPAELVRSPTRQDVYWNTVEIEKKRFLVDVMHRPTQLYPLHSIAYYAYTRITPPSTHPNHQSVTEHHHESLLSYDASALSAAPVASKQSGSAYRWVLPQDLSRAQLVLLNKLGSGGFGAVWRCKLGGFTCAIKIVNTESMAKPVTYNVPDLARKRVMQEIELLQRLQHRHIVSFLGKEIKEKELHIYMELVPHSLYELIQQIKRQDRSPFTPDEIITCISHMAKGLMYLHALPDKVIHRDIKSKNVLIELSDNQIHTAKLCDFGVSKIVTETTQADTSIGTSRWMAPEVIAVLDGKKEAYDEKSDVWGMGMVLYEMLTLQLPYEDVGLFDVRQHVLQGHRPSMPSLEGEYEPFLSLLENCTKYNPAERYSAEQALLHLLRL